jgi:hypothetical protein
MRVTHTLLAALAALTSFAAHAAPAAPVVTVGAGIKSFRFDWDPVAGSARYELWQRASASAAFQKAAEYSAATTEANLDISVHTIDGSGARVRLAACN